MVMSWFVPMSQTRGIRVALVGVSYVGATLVVGAVAIALGVYGRRWTDITGTLLLSALAAVTAGGGLGLAGGSRGLAAYRMGWTSARHHVAGLLFAVAAGSAGAAVGVLATAHQWFAGSAVGLMAAVLGYAVLPTASGVLAVSALSVGLAVSTAAEVVGPRPLAVGAALVAVGALLCLASAVGPVRHGEFGVSIGAVIALAGAQLPLAEAEAVGWSYGLSFAVAVACFVLFHEVPAVMLLVVGTCGVALAVLEATWNVTSGPASLVATLAATGATLMVAGALGTRLWQARGQRELTPRVAPRASEDMSTSTPMVSLPSRLPPPRDTEGRRSTGRGAGMPTRPDRRSIRPPMAAISPQRQSGSPDPPTLVPMALAAGRARSDP
jgi:hypothetical protein